MLKIVFVFCLFSVGSHAVSDECCVPLRQHPLYLKYPNNEKILIGLQKFYCGYFQEPYVYCLDQTEVQLFLLEVLQKCTTPNGKNGTCLPLNSCTNLYNNTIHQTSVSFGFTYDSLCGHSQQPIVCCSNDSEYSLAFASNLPSPQKCGHWTTEKYPPWMVKIDNEQNHCLGSLITKNYVLTKASCVVERKSIRVHLLLCQSTCIYNVSEIKTFPIYKLPYKITNDIVLLKLSEDVTGVEPICLHEEPLEVYAELTATLLTKFKSGYVVYNHTDVTVYQDDCIKKYNQATDRDFCMAMEGRDCLRHSLKGAPLQFYNEETGQWYFAGISKLCTFEPPANMLLAERIYTYVKWIKSNIS